MVIHPRNLNLSERTLRCAQCSPRGKQPRGTRGSCRPAALRPGTAPARLRRPRAARGCPGGCGKEAGGTPPAPPRPPEAASHAWAPPAPGARSRCSLGERPAVTPPLFFFFFFLSRQRVSAKKELPTAVSLTPRGRSLPFFSPFSSLSLKPAPSPLFQSATEITERGAGAAALPSAPRCSPCPEPTPGAATCCVPLSLRHGGDGGPPPAATAPRKRGAMRAHLHRCTQQQRLGGVGHLLQK